MSKLKNILLAVLTACTAVGVSMAVAACKDNNKYADFRQPANYVPPTGPVEGDGEYNGKYVVNVKSAGGAALNGVMITAKKNGEEILSGISMDGKVEFTLDYGVYDLEVNADSLPLGYYVPEGTSYATVADKEQVDLILYSSVITQTAPSGTSYSLGDVMYDFSFTDVNGLRHTLSSLLGQYKAVMLNFWYVECNPCRAEFPAVQEAYSAYSDKLALLAINNTNSDSAISQFKQENGYTFPMGSDRTGITSLFSVSAYPTTVIIDRYGVVAYRSSGTQTNASAWKGLFNTYTSDNYTQSTQKGDDSTLPTEWAKVPEGAAMPESGEIAAAVNGVGTQDKITEYYPETNESDVPYSFPWKIEDDEYGSYITASNSKTQYSFAIIYAKVTMNSGDALSYYYNVDTEQDCDFLYALVNGEIVATHSGASSNPDSANSKYGKNWAEAAAVYVADHTVTVELSFIYIKDQADPDNFTGSDTASVRDINIRPVNEVVSTIDQRTSVVDKLTLEDGKYKQSGFNFVDSALELNKNDGYYYVSYRDNNGAYRKSLLLTDILNVTYWAEKHMGSRTFLTPENNDEKASLYRISYWTMSNYDRAETDSSALEFNYGHTDLLIDSYYLQEFSDNSLLPVTPARMEMIKDFIKEFYSNNSDMLAEGDEYYEDQWLEFCFYFAHYGHEHEDGVCSETADPIKGLIYENAYDAVANYTEEDVAAGKYVNNVNITKIINLSDGGGLKYKFVPEKSGVYYIHSDFTAQGIDPRVMLADANGNVYLDVDDDLRPTAFDNPKRFNFYVYSYFEAGKTYYVHAAMHYFQDTGKYDLYIDYAGEYVETLQVCTTGAGAWTYDQYGKLYYLAIPTVYNNSDGYYHERTEDYDYGSVIYVDFLNQNFFDENKHSLLWMCQNNNGDNSRNSMFDFRKEGGRDYTQKMLSYYYKSINGKSEDDELYGKIEANKEIVNILNMLIQKQFEEGPDANGWLMFACYYVRCGTPSD